MMTFFNILAVLAATIMGFSIQRGATCTVAALDEIIRFKKINRLLAMIEAAIWVAVGLGLATHFGIIQTLPNGFEITYWTVAGAMFLGRYSSEALGDYCAGPNHVLPTSRTARFSSPLGVYDFQKRSSMIFVSEQGAQTLGKVAAELAYGEGLQAHARSAELRLK